MPTYAGLDPGYGGLKGFFLDKKGQFQSLRDSRGGNYWPSYVFQTPEGKVLIGHDAKNQGVVHPNRVAHGWKEFLGDDVKRYFNATATAVDVLTMMLVIVVAAMEKQSGMKIDGFVVLCPANYNDAQRRGLLKACEKAGIKIIQLITEPAASAFAYCIRDRAGVGRTSLVACADLGHGTFDFSVLEIKEGIAVPIATEGIAKHGGRDYTDVVEKLLLEKVSKEIGKPVVKDKLPPELLGQLREKAEMAKHDLSGQPSVSVPLHFAGTSKIVEITQKEYESACEGLHKALLNCMDKAMKSVGKTYKDLESFVLAGAPFNNLRLQELLADHTGMAVRAEHDPGTVGAYGAALHGQNLARQEGGQVALPDQPILTEATRQDIGIAVIDESTGSRQTVCSVVIKKNTPIPCKITQSFRLERADQTAAAVDVLEGAEGKLASQCQRITGIFLPGLKPNAQRAPRIDVSYEIDKNGQLTVTVKDGPDGPSDSVSVLLKK